MKLSGDQLKELLKCIKKDERVVVPPNIGYDAGVHLLDGKYLVVSTDPCTGVPEDWFGFLLINYAASDVALSGAKPEFCTINLLGPRSTKPETFQKIMQQTCIAADELGIAIVRGHTGMYDSISEMLGVCTVYGTVEPEKLITSGGAKPGDLILCTKPLGLETVTNFSLTHPERAKKLFGEKQAAALAGQVRLQSCVKEALTLAKLEGVHAMHDVTEGGFVSALNELSEASKVGFQIQWEQILFCPQVHTLEAEFRLSDVQLLSLSSTGTILVAVDPNVESKVIAALEAQNLSASFLGTFTENQNCKITRQGKETVFPQVQDDPYTKIMASK